MADGLGPAGTAATLATPVALSKRPLTWAVLLFGVLLAINLVRVQHHAMWRDEGQAWMIAQAATSPADVWTQRRYERQPPLWHLALYGVNQVWPHPFAMQVFSALLSSMAMALLLMLPWWSWPQRLLLTFNYYVVFEYAVISRCYVLAFFLFAVLVWVSSREAPWVPWAEFLLLGLLALTSVYGTMIALSLGVERLLHRGRTAWQGPAWILLAVLPIVVLSVLPPPDWKDITPPMYFGWSAGKARAVLATAAMAIAPLPQPTQHFWDSYWLREVPLIPRLMCVLVLLCAAGWTLWRSRSALVLFAGSWLGLAAFMYTVYFGRARHHGTLFVIFLGLLLLDPRLRRSLHASRVLTALLAVGAAGGVIAIVQETQHPFSSAQDTAAWIQQELGPDSRVLIVGHRSFIASAVTAYLEREMFYPDRMDRGTFVRWNTQRIFRAPTEVLQTTARLVQEQGEVVLVVECWFPSEADVGTLPIVHYAIFRSGIVSDECYVALHLKRSGP